MRAAVPAAGAELQPVRLSAPGLKSEGISAADLHEPLAAVDGRDDAGCRAAADGVARGPEVGMIQCVESFQTELEASNLLWHGEDAAHSEVECDAVGIA